MGAVPGTRSRLDTEGRQGRGSRPSDPWCRGRPRTGTYSRKRWRTRGRRVEGASTCTYFKYIQVGRGVTTVEGYRVLESLRPGHGTRRFPDLVGDDVPTHRDLFNEGKRPGDKGRRCPTRHDLLDYESNLKHQNRSRGGTREVGPFLRQPESCRPNPGFPCPPVEP